MSTSRSFNRGRPSAASTRGDTRSQGISTAGQDFIRAMSIQDRARLTQGKLIEIFDHRGIKIEDFPLALFNAASTQQDRVIDDKVTIPFEYDVQQVKRFLSKILFIAKSQSNVELAPVNDIGVDLHYHSAAEWLGMGSFTQSIFDFYFKAVNKMLPAEATIEAIQQIRTPPGEKIFKQMVYKLATQYFEDKIHPREAFESYLDSNECLKQDVMDIFHRKEVNVMAKAAKEEKDLALQARERRRQEKAKDDVPRNKLNEELEVQRRNELARREAVVKKEADIRASMLAKKRAGQKLNLEEARMHFKVFGKAVPAFN